MKQYDVHAVEAKWQKIWEETKPFAAVDFHPTKPKYYILYEFPNVSGSSLHMGHLKGTIPADVLARYKRLDGLNVLFPIGGDAFGLPAEDAALKTGIDPHEFVANGMKKFAEQFKRLGMSFDWDRTICTSDPEYYKWTQWIFKELYKHGKAYKQMAKVNFCPHCKTVLSNEDSQGGKCDRCGSDVVQEERWVWYLKMQEYAEKMLQNVDRIKMVESQKEAQRNWIGRSEGMQVSFDVVADGGKSVGKLDIFTTCIETIFGVTFVSVAPENKLIDALKPYITNWTDIEAYRAKTALRTDLDRMANQKQKTGCKVEGLSVVNPVNGSKVPMFLADFVLAGYGTGAVMAVPTGDQRDYDFAKAFSLPMVDIMEGREGDQALEKKEYLAKNCKMINSGKFDGMPVKKAKAAIADYVVELGAGKKTVNYKMGDWPFNRQRYWGEPFPVVFCDHCGTVVLEDKDLPLVLPKTNDYTPGVNGSGALSKIDSFVNCTCPKCGRPAKHETDTMPNWAGSSWYWLRYTDPHNDECLADCDKLKYWGSVDCYTGGAEHVTRHVLYSFFWQNFLYEIGAVPTRDPFIRKMCSGLILDDTGHKMSKSSKNGVSPMEIIEKYGTDVARLHTHFLGGYEDNTPWTMDGITGITTFLDKVWALQDIVKGDEVSGAHIGDLHKLIKKIGEDYEDLKLNTAISAFMIFIKKIKKDGFITREELRQFLILLNPLAPHITSEEYEAVFGKNILEDSWPKFEEKYLVDDTMDLPVQINGKLNRVIKVPTGSSQDEIMDYIYNNCPEICRADETVKKIVYVPNRILNIIK